MTESTHEHVEAVIRGKAKRDWWSVILIALVLALVGWIAVDKMHASQRADVAVSNATSLAEQIQRACAEGSVIVVDRNICARADAVADAPAAPVVGQPGADGINGTDGVDSTVPGPAGRDGTDSTIPGPVGPAGVDGDDGQNGDPGTDGATGPTGPAGADGMNGADGAAGPAGLNGTNGLDGRGISSLECVDTATSSDWVVTYADTTTATTPGPCRVPTTTP